MGKFEDTLKTRALLADGAMGTMLQEGGLKPGGSPEGLNLTDPELIHGIHKKYVEAGADILTANTFGGNRIKLAEYGLENRLAEVNRRAVLLARSASEGAGRPVFVAGDIGPTGRFAQPVGDMSFDEAYDIYAEQSAALAEAGADLILIETMSDIKEAKAALIAAKENTRLPVVVTMTFQQDLRSLLGTPPDVAVCVLEAAGADLIGANCSLGPDGLYEAAKVMASLAGVPLIFQPNAGLPKLVGGKTVFPASPADLAEYAGKFLDLGAGIIGSCCGSTPAHTAAMAEVLRARSGARPGSCAEPGPTRLASRTRLVSIGRGSLPAIIGERINPTGRKDLTAELSDGRTSLVKREAKEQAEHGAMLVDINVGLPGGDELELMPKVVRAVEEAADLPIVIDSTDPAAIEAALKECSGKPLVNSVTGDRARLDAVLPLVKKYGAAVVGLTIDENGVPATSEKRAQIAARILGECLAYGIRKDDLVIDPLVLTASAEQEQARETLKAVPLIKDGLGLTTSLGVSNISFGLPRRPLINSTYLAMALGCGLDAAMVNPYDERMGEIVAAAGVLTGRDKRAESYIARHKKELASRQKTAADEAVGESHGDGEGLAAKAVPPPLEARLRLAIIDGDKENIIPLIEAALQEGLDPLTVSNNCLIPALTEVGRLFEKKEIFLPQVMQSAETMKAAFARLKAEMKPGAEKDKGTVVLATVFGDVHDIGKNILATLLENHGIHVVDLGKNVPKEVVLAAAENERADVIGLSALMTTTMTQMEEVIKERDSRGMKTPVVLGGAVVTAEYAEKVGAAGSSRDALEAVKLIKGLIGK